MFVLYNVKKVNYRSLDSNYFKERVFMASISVGLLSLFSEQIFVSNTARHFRTVLTSVEHATKLTTAAGGNRIKKFVE